MVTVQSLCSGPRTVAKVDVELIQTIDGRADRKVTVTRDCGHLYFWGGRLDMPIPLPGSPAMGCLGVQEGAFRREGDAAPAVFDPRKRPAKRRKVA